ncbi:MAG: hypothetical protein M0P01_00935 [Treponema sp.]|nr:hypothetical protein [Treponema sp.]
MRKIISAMMIYAACICTLYADDNGRIKFIKGNISDKTAAVRDASDDSEAADLANAAIDFALTNKSELGDDRDLDGLAVAGVLALPTSSVSSYNQNMKDVLVNKFGQLFREFSSDTVRIAVINKTAILNDTVTFDSFVQILNDFLQNSDGSTPENGVVKAAVNTLGIIGNSQSFSVIYDCVLQQKWPQYSTEMNNTLSLLADKSIPQIIGIIQDGNTKTIRQLFDLLCRNNKNSSSFKAEIAENVLSETIYIADNSSTVTKETVSIQLDAMRIISQLKWTRSSAVMISFFNLAKREYIAGIMTDDEFAEVINGVANVAPIDSSAVLATYLMELNKQTENGTKLSDKVVLAIINALGAIGDKSSFDSLLYVTYVNYPENIIAAARDALARLKW